MDSKIKTRLLIISDTHGMDFSPAHKPLQHADVAIHCGDLTGGSKLEEFRTTIQLLKDINAPLKLAIAGNHDFTMDIPTFEKKVEEVTPPLDPELVAKEYGTLGEARHLFEGAKDAGIIYLDEGTHQFTLKNAALLMVYASPYTPALGAWGFQYHPERGHNFSIRKEVDVAITHGPPRGIMDYTYSRERAGCPNLFAAVARARPRVHCFGISTKVGAQNWLPGEKIMASNQPISQLSTTTDPLW
jgi:Calcineurin-like phosphoesterase